jgi:cardiolipin synthase
MLVDHEVAAVGTANMDNRSFRLNFEVTAILADREFASDVERMLKTDFADCREYDQSEYDNRPLWFKLAVRVARLASPVL